MGAISELPVLVLIPSDLLGRDFGSATSTFAPKQPDSRDETQNAAHLRRPVVNCATSHGFEFGGDNADDARRVRTDAAAGTYDRGKAHMCHRPIVRRWPAT